jgi:RNA polymerase sigma-70 factor, ECF subfamily
VAPQRGMLIAEGAWDGGLGVTQNELLTLATSVSNRLKRFAYHLCGDADVAEDLVQEGFLRALGYRAQLRDSRRALPWLLMIIRRLFLENLRKAERHLRLIAEDQALTDPPAGNLEEEMFRSVLSEELSNALAALPEEWRTCLLLRELDGFSYDEIAEIAECPVGTVRSRLARARAQLLVSLHTYAADRGVSRGAQK